MPVLIFITRWKREKGKGCLEPPSTTRYFVEMWEERGYLEPPLLLYKMARI